MENLLDDDNSTISIIKKEPFLIIAFLIGIWILSIVLGNLISQFYLGSLGISDTKYLMEEIKNGNIESNVAILRVMGGITNFFAYLIPSLAFALIVYQQNWKKELLLNKLPKWQNLLFVLAIIFASSFFIRAIYYYNTIWIPEENVAKDILSLEKLMMQMNSVKDLLANLIVFGLIAGIGEELFFRGVLQKLLTKSTNNIHIGALLTGLLFTLVHFQPEGFIPRLILSLFFSYFLIYTANLWITIVVHIFFNSFQVFLLYFLPNLTGGVDKVEYVPLSYALFSLLCTVGLWIMFVRKNETTYINLINNNK